MLTHKLSLSQYTLTHQQKNREIFSSNLFPSYLPKREVRNLLATLVTSNYCVCTGQWVAEGWGDIPVFLLPPADGYSSLGPGGQPKGVGGQLSEYKTAGPWLRGVTSVYLEES